MRADGGVDDKGADNRSEKHVAESAAIEVADNFFEDEGDAGEGRVKRRCQARGGAGGICAPPVLFRDAEQLRQAGGEITPDLHRRSFPAETLPAADADDAGNKLNPGDTARSVSKLFPIGKLHLRDAAPGRVWGEGIQQPADQERAKHDDDQT